MTRVEVDAFAVKKENSKQKSNKLRKEKRRCEKKKKREGN